MSNRKQARLQAKHFIDTLSVQPYPNSSKIYVEGLGAQKKIIETGKIVTYITNIQKQDDSPREY